MSRNGKGYIYAIISGLAYGLIPLAILAVSRSKAATSAFCLASRVTFGAILLAPLALKRAGTSRRPAHRWLKTILGAAISSATGILLYTAYNYIPSGIGITIHYLYPVCCLAFNVILFKEKVARVTVIALIMSVAGVALMCDPQALPENAWIGLLLAFASAMSCGGYYVYLERTGLAAEDPVVYCGRQLVFSSIFISSYVGLRGEMHVDLSWTVVLCLVAAGILGLIGLLTQMKGIDMIGADLTTILATLEPITLALGGVLLLGDRLSVRSWFGIAMVLAAVVLLTVMGRKKKQTASAGE